MTKNIYIYGASGHRDNAHQSFWLDIKILWMTFLKVVNRGDIGSDTAVEGINLGEITLDDLKVQRHN